MFFHYSYTDIHIWTGKNFAQAHILATTPCVKSGLAGKWQKIISRKF